MITRDDGGAAAAVVIAVESSGPLKDDVKTDVGPSASSATLAAVARSKEPPPGEDRPRSRRKHRYRHLRDRNRDLERNREGGKGSCLVTARRFNISGYFRELAASFGAHFVFLLALNYFFVKGVVYVFVQGVQLPYFKHLGVDGIQYQIFNIIALTPWAMKGIIGSVSDSFAWGGYHKRYYMIACCLLGFCSLLLLALIPYRSARNALWLPPILFFAAMFQIATMDLLIEGKYTELMRSRPDGNVNLVTFVWTCITLGSLAASGVVGPLVDHLGPYVIFWLTVPLTLILLVPLCLGFLPEEPVPPSLHNRLQIQKLRDKGPFFIVAITCALGAIILAGLGLLGMSTLQCIYSIMASVVLILMSYRAMPRQLADSNFYMYLQESLYIGLSGTLDFWYTAAEDCVPNGPHFDYTYYQTYSQLLGHAASIIGLVMFQTLMKNWKFRHVYWISTVLRVLASMFDLIILKRWNIAIGVNDYLAYLLGDSIIMPITTMLNFMPGVLLTAKLCPHSMESTVYAILAGFSNFGQNTAKSIGVFLQRAAKVESQPPKCNFDNLPMLIVLGHGILPLLCVPLTFVLMPNARMSDTLQCDEDQTATLNTVKNNHKGPKGKTAPEEELPTAPRNGHSKSVDCLISDRSSDTTPTIEQKHDHPKDSIQLSSSAVVFSGDEHTPTHTIKTQPPASDAELPADSRHSSGRSSTALLSHDDRLTSPPPLQGHLSDEALQSDEVIYITTGSDAELSPRSVHNLSP